MPLAGVSCLIVDDSDQAETDAAVLERAGAEVGRVRTVFEAVLALSRCRWALLLVNPTLPDGSGYQVVAYAAVTRRDTAILIASDAEPRPPSVGPFERAFTFLKRDRDQLVRCAQLAFMQVGVESVSSPAGTPAPSRKDQVSGFSNQYRLSQRQKQVLTMLVGGTAPKDIARRLAISPITIRRHAEEIYRKCGVRCQRELLALIARTTMGAHRWNHRPLARADLSE
jgi:DNA-binding NarL/FixJ family response regulator